MLDLTKVDPRFLELKYSEHQESAFVFRSLVFKIHTNGNLNTIKFVIDLKGELQLRINPKFTWGLIRNTVAKYYDWCRAKQEQRYSQFDLTSLISQQERKLVDNDLIYLWGLPYLLRINAYTGKEDEVKITHRPKQVTPVLVPKGRSRYSDKFYYLLHNGYIHPYALDNLPMVNQEEWLLPRKCLFDHPDDFIRYPLISKSLLDPKLRTIYDRSRPMGNFFLELMGQTLHRVSHDAKSHHFYGSRYLSYPQRHLIETIIAPLALRTNPDFIVRRHHERIVAKCENLTFDYWKAIVTGPITYKERRPNFPLNPYLNYELDTVRANDPSFSQDLSCDIYATLQDQRLVRTNVLPVEFLWRGMGSSEERRQEVRIAQEHGAYVDFYPEIASYLNPTIEGLMDAYRRHIKFYQSGILDRSLAQQNRNAYMAQASTQTLERAALENTILRPAGESEPPLSEPELFSPQLLLDKPQIAFEENPELIARTAYKPEIPPHNRNLSIDELEITLCDSDGHEIDPALALMAILPDNPDQSNYLENMPQELALRELKTSYQRKLATDLLLQHVPPINLGYSHETLATPGCLEVNIKGKVTEEKVRKALQHYLANEVSTKATHFMELVHDYYDEVYLAATQVIAMPTLRWYKCPVRSKAMSPLGLCRADGTIAEIRLNQILAHYPYNVMTSVASHELCHLGCLNHGPAFYLMLGALNPNANIISDSMGALGIVPI